MRAHRQVAVDQRSVERVLIGQQDYVQIETLSRQASCVLLKILTLLPDNLIRQRSAHTLDLRIKEQHPLAVWQNTACDSRGVWIWQCPPIREHFEEANRQNFEWGNAHRSQGLIGSVLEAGA